MDSSSADSATPPQADAPQIDPIQVLFGMQQQITNLTNIISNLTQHPIQSPSPPTTSTFQPSVKIATPVPFDGSLDKAETYLSQLSLYFTGKNLSDTEKVNIALSYMQNGTAAEWAKSMVQEATLAQTPP